MKRVICLLAAVMMLLTGCKVMYVEDESTQAPETETQREEKHVNINIWYNDADYEAYLLSCADDYMAANKNVTITPMLLPESNYEDTLIDMAINGTGDGSVGVDMYLLRNDELEKMRLAGLAADNNMADIYSVYNYSEKALSACTYRDRLIAYPLSFNTSFLVYNSDLVSENLPTTFEELKNLAEGIELPTDSHVRAVFSCDLNDIFYNYGFLGGYLYIGGKNGDDKSRMFEITEELTAAVNQYKHLIDYFYIDINSVDYYSCVNEFENGEIIFTVADTNMLARFEEDSSQENTLNYGVLPLLDLNVGVATSPLSITTAVVVNPLSKNRDVAESFAKYLTYTNANNIYGMTGQVASRDIYDGDDVLGAVYESYEKSTPKLKLMYSDEFYALLEVVMHLIATGEDDVQALTAVSGYLESHWGD